MLERAIELYWDRYEAIATEFGYLRPPRLRNTGWVRDASTVRPYAQILNESTCTLHLEDLDPETSTPRAGRVPDRRRRARRGNGPTCSVPAVHLAPWWFDRTDAECDAFGPGRDDISDVPDADSIAPSARRSRGYARSAIAAPGPRRQGPTYREIPDTGLLVPRAHEEGPDRLFTRIQESAARTLTRVPRGAERSAESELADFTSWLAAEAPLVVVTDATSEPCGLPRSRWHGKRSWNTCVAAARGSSRASATISRASTSTAGGSWASLQEPDAPSRAQTDLAQSGYTFVHRDRGIIGYNLDEPGIERLLGPGDPVRARHARSANAATSGLTWRRCRLRSAGRFLREVDPAARRAGGRPPRRDRGTAQERAAGDRSRPRPTRSRIATRATRWQTSSRGAYRTISRICSRRGIRHPRSARPYVRQNIRPLRREYPASDRLRMLVRYAYERQYLGFSDDRGQAGVLRRAHLFEVDFLDSGFVNEERLAALLHAAAELCGAFGIDDARFTSRHLIRIRPP